MAAEDNKTFFNNINTHYKNYIEETIYIDKQHAVQALIDEILREHRDDSWSKHPDIIIDTVGELLSEKSSYDSSKGDFSNYLLTALKNNINAEEEKLEREDENEVSLYKQDEKGNSYLETAISSLSIKERTQITDVERFLDLEYYREYLSKVQEAFDKERPLKKNNYFKRRIYATADFLNSFEGHSYGVSSEDLFHLHEEFSFIEKKIWYDYFIVHDFTTGKTGAEKNGKGPEVIQLVCKEFGLNYHSVYKDYQRFVEKYKLSPEDGNDIKKITDA